MFRGEDLSYADGEGQRGSMHFERKIKKNSKFEHHFHVPRLDRCKRAIMQSVSKVCWARPAGQWPLHDVAAAFTVKPAGRK